MRMEIRPGHFVLVDQFIDRTRGRTAESTFFGDGCVAHAHFADPVWEPLRKLALDGARRAGAQTHDGGTYLCMEGPHFSTRAESELYRSWGVDVIGMTNLQEAKLAREAEIAYATIALATDYDCWHEEEQDVNVADVLAVLRANVERARQTILETVRLLAESSERISCAGAMEHAIITAPEAISADARRRLDLLIGKYLG
jgi:5'-methylthioadenosine phosphorylase